jgi:zinc protease
MLVVAGDFDEAKALQCVQKYFGAIPRPQRKLAAPYTEEPSQDGERLVTLRRVGDVGAVGVAYHIPAAPHADFPVLQVLGNILSTQPSGRLYKALVESRKASSVFAGARALHDPSLFMIQATVRRGNSLDEVRDTVLALVEEIGAKGVTEEEVQRARQQILKQRELAAAETNQIAISLSEWAAQGDWRLYFLHRDRIEQVTASDVQRVAAQYLLRNNRTVGLYIPTAQPERVAIPNTPDVKALVSNYKGRETITAGEAMDVNPASLEARIQRQELPEGIKVALLPKKTRGDEVQVRLVLHYGNEDNLKELVAAASFLPQLMLRGTKKLTYQQLQDELDRQKATLSAGGFGGGRRGGRGGGGGSDPGTVSFSIQTKRDNLPAVLGLLRQVLREPTLPAEEFEVMKRARLAGLEQQRTEPSALAARLLQRQLAPYPKDDVRYVPTIEEEIQRMQAATPEQVRRLYQDYLSSQAGELTIVGDFDPGTALPILRETLGGWKAAQPYARIKRPAQAEIAGGRQVIVTPDKANATYAAGIVLPLDDKDPDYPALIVANQILGGSTLASRLGDRVRQREGLSYGISSGFNASAFDRRAGLTISAICNPQNMDKLERAVREELDLLLREGIKPDELASARQGYLQSRRIMRSNDTTLAGLLASALQEGRTLSHHAELEKKIEALTPEKVMEVLRKHLDPKKLVIVCAGDFEKKAAGN